MIKSIKIRNFDAKIDSKQILETKLKINVKIEDVKGVFARNGKP